MRYTLLIALVAATLAQSGTIRVQRRSSSGSLPTFVQDAKSTSGSPRSAPSITATVTTGNTLILSINGSQNVAWNFDTGGFPGVCTDGVNDAKYTLDANQVSGAASTVRTGIVRAFNVTGGSLTITCHLTAATYGPLILQEWSPLTAQDGTTGSDGTAANPQACGSTTTSVGNVVAFSSLASSNSVGSAGMSVGGTPGTYTIGTNSVENNGGAFGLGALAYQASGSANTFAPTWDNTLHTSPFAACVTVAYK